MLAGGNSIHLVLCIPCCIELVCGCHAYVVKGEPPHHVLQRSWARHLVAKSKSGRGVTRGLECMAERGSTTAGSGLGHATLFTKQSSSRRHARA
ncbi:hypothetical protein PF011_g3598 [Phytophthora fragariae]|uniref:Secreted protein n=1 Tax=Phytophthora fragariae TaxID=53985 RepID=A0A6A3M7H6_9STRA|nr:hypothetical protein PF011_g3598 [Phytophthora fragariae]